MCERPVAGPAHPGGKGAAATGGGRVGVIYLAFGPAAQKGGPTCGPAGLGQRGGVSLVKV